MFSLWGAVLKQLETTAEFVQANTDMLLLNIDWLVNVQEQALEHVAAIKRDAGHVFAISQENRATSFKQQSFK